jgi:hypothetical protein
MKYVVELGSGVMIYIANFTKIGSDIQKLMGGGGIAVYCGRKIPIFRRNLLLLSS